MTTALPHSTRDEIEYPSSDGQPVAETEVHVEELLAWRDLLVRRFASRPDVYAGGNLLFYYEEGNPAARFSPDVFVVMGVPKRRRRVYRLWEERVPPTFVLEISSRGTWLDDAGNKKALCARLGVQEYFLFDPEAEWLDPPLQGFSLQAGEYRRIEPSADGKVESKAVGLAFWAEGTRLGAVDPATGEELLRSAELEAAWRRSEEEANRAGTEAKRARAAAEHAEVEAERARVEAEAERARAEAAEREVRRLEQELRARKDRGP